MKAENKIGVREMCYFLMLPYVSAQDSQIVDGVEVGVGTCSKVHKS